MKDFLFELAIRMHETNRLPHGSLFFEGNRLLTML